MTSNSNSKGQSPKSSTKDDHTIYFKFKALSLVQQGRTLKNLGTKNKKKDCIKNTLQKTNIYAECLRKNLHLDRSPWTKVVHNSKKDFEQNRVVHKNLKRDVRKGLGVNPSEKVVTEFDQTCNVCGRGCRSRAEQKSQVRHIHKEDIHCELYGISTYRDCKKFLSLCTKMAYENPPKIKVTKDAQRCPFCARERKTIVELKSCLSTVCILMIN